MKLVQGGLGIELNAEPADPSWQDIGSNDGYGRTNLEDGGVLAIYSGEMAKLDPGVKATYETCSSASGWGYADPGGYLYAPVSQLNNNRCFRWATSFGEYGGLGRIVYKKGDKDSATLDITVWENE